MRTEGSDGGGPRAPQARPPLLHCPVPAAPSDPRPPRLKEPFNALSHLLGVIVASVGGTVLVVGSWDEPWRVASFAVFALASIALFTASTLLHAVRAGPRLESRLRRADHAAIFVLIAGSYTPITLVTLREHGSPWGWPLFAVVWVLGAAGVLFKLVWFTSPRWLSTVLYLVLGWMAVMAIGPLVRALAPGGVALLIAGGLLYSLGAVIYARKRPDWAPRTVGYHGIWHLFVLAGWGCHLALMLAYVLPR